MKKSNLLLELLIGLMIFSCSSNSTMLAQNNYKGAPKHQQPSIEILPKSTEYILDQNLNSGLMLKLDQKIDELFEKHNVAGITATVLIPEKGIWETNRGFITELTIDCEECRSLELLDSDRLINAIEVQSKYCFSFPSFYSRLRNHFKD